MDSLSHTAAQGDDGDKSWFWFCKCEVAICTHIGIGVDDSLAIRTEDPNTVCLGVGKTIFLNGLTFGTDLRESSTIKNDKLDPLLPTIINRLGYKLARDNHMHDVDIAGNIQNRFEGFNAKNFVSFQADGIDGSFKPKINKILDDPIPY